MQYRLLAVDMDGTLLNSDKQISFRDAEALNRALEGGVTVVFSTGRCIGELKPFFPLFPGMRYVLGESGALIYDLERGRAIRRISFPPQTVEEIWRRTRERDLMPQLLMADQPVMNRRDVANLAHFRMAHYQSHFDRNGKQVEEVWALCREQSFAEVDKICLYHTDPEERVRTRQALEGLPLSLVDAEETSLELSPPGIDKGKGLCVLCEHLGLSPEQTVVIGDSYNDLSVLRASGLPVAMGNAVDEVKRCCAAVVADNDHFGVAEAVERFLLQ